MAKTCIKCGYTRRESDAAPDYECPACGVVYAKAEAAHAQGVVARARAAAPTAPRPLPATGSPATPVAADDPKARADALIQQLRLADPAQRRGPSPYRGMAMVALLAFSVGFASAAGMYSAAAKINKAGAAKASAVPGDCAK